MSEQQSWRSFPKTFWTANTIELFERAAYYAMASFVVIYLKETLGMSPTFAGFINGTLLWGLIYFLPILSGTMADKFGYKRSLSLAFVLLTIGYVVMGNIHRVWPKLVASPAGTIIDYTLPVIIGVIFIGIGGSIVKPCIAGTVQKTSGTMPTLAFGIFYMVINIGSITGRVVSYIVRKKIGIPAIFFPVAALFVLAGLIVVFVIYREPQFVSDGRKDGQQVKRKTLGQALAGIILVLSSVRFVFFILVIGLFWFLYVQLYNLMPLFLRFIDPKAPVELYILANPIMIVCFQLLITRMVKKWTPVRTIMLGISVVTIGMLVNIIPALFLTDILQKTSVFGLVIPVAGIFMIISIAAMAVGEMMASPRIYEYLGAIAPKGEEGLYMGYANLPLALASMIGGPLGGRLFETYIDKPVKAGMTPNVIPIWLIIGAIGVISFIGMAIFNSFLSSRREGSAT